MKNLTEVPNTHFLKESDLKLINGGGTGFKALGRIFRFFEDLAYAGQDAYHMGMA